MYHANVNADLMEENVIQINGGIMINASVKKCHICEKDYVSNPATFSCDNVKYLSSIMDDLEIMCDEILELYDEKTKATPTNFNEKKATCKMQIFYILLTFLLITILIAVSNYC